MHKVKKNRDVFRCLSKGEARATCEERPFCMDIEVVLAKDRFEQELFERIIRSDGEEIPKI